MASFANIPEGGCRKMRSSEPDQMTDRGFGGSASGRPSSCWPQLRAPRPAVFQVETASHSMEACKGVRNPKDAGYGTDEPHQRYSRVRLSEGELGKLLLCCSGLSCGLNLCFYFFEIEACAMLHWRKAGSRRSLRAAHLKGRSRYSLGPLDAASASAILFPISALTASRLKLAPRCIGG